jgi:hypothetical protein
MLFMGDPEDDGLGTLTLDQQLRLNQFEFEGTPMPDPKLVKKAAECRQENNDLQSELAALKKKLAKLNEEKNTKQKDWEFNQLSEEFAFGERYYQCLAPHPGVGYRNTPVFPDKNDGGDGPVEGEVIKATAIVQGPQGIFLRCSSGHGWLPLTNPEKKDARLFGHLGRKDKFNLKDHPNLKMAAYAIKVKSPKSKSPKNSP